MSAATAIPVSRSSYSSTVTHPDSSDSRRSATAKENKFAYQHGSKLHTYAREKAPYPLSYNREVLELWLMDRSLLLSTHKTVSFVDFQGKFPKRCLDVGTGMGDWVIEAAKGWPNCTFVGYDLMNVQIGLETLPASIANRIEWVHGNFLRIKLPFEDEEFDHIHIQDLAFAVPENKWVPLFDEFRRVLRRGGTIEQKEDDAIFPVLPRWFTEPLHAHSRGPFMHYPDGSQYSLDEPVTHHPEGSHEYELLEILYYDVFNNRFLSPTPTSVLPSYFSSYFGHVVSPPAVTFPMPPLAPLTPAPYELTVSNTPPRATSHMSDPPDTGFLPPVRIDTSDFSLPGSLPSSSPSSSYSTAPSSSTSTRGSWSFDGASNSARNSFVPKFARTPSVATIASRDSDSRKSQRIPSTTMRDDSDSAQIGRANIIELFPETVRHELVEHSLSMQLYRALWIVLGVKEAMFEELMARIAKGDPTLRGHGWDDRVHSELSSRQRFEGMMEQFKKDVLTRIALWNSLVLHGWPFPRRDPLSKAEQLEEERLRQDILEARRSANEEELKDVIRSMRVIVGQKV